MLRVVPPLAKVRDIRSALRRRKGAEPRESLVIGKVIDLRAYTGKNVIRFPRRGEPTTVA